MELNNLRPAKGSTHKIKRIGRGQGSGRGGTATRGHKGDKARSGHKNKRGFEGGQTPMQRRLPKRGLKTRSTWSISLSTWINYKPVQRSMV